MNTNENHHEKRIDQPAGFVSLAVVILVGLLAASCEQPFEPFHDDERYFFSIFGFLDASADTQWVRVMPLRDTLHVTPGDLEMEVTLEHLEGNKSVVMNDSLFGYPPRLAVPTVLANNSWTMMPLEPEQTYRLEASLPDGRNSEVIVEMPPAFPPPEINYAGLVNRVHIPGVERLAALQSYYHVRLPAHDTEHLFSIPNLSDTTEVRGTGDYPVAVFRTGEDYFKIETALSIMYPDPFSVIPVAPAHDIIDSQLFVASAGPGWPLFGSLNEIAAAVPDVVTNVQGGVGFLGGVVSHTLPYRQCIRSDGGVPTINAPERREPISCGGSEDPLWYKMPPIHLPLVRWFN